MNEQKNLLAKIKSKTINWSELSIILRLSKEELKPFFKFAYNETKRNFNNTLKVYNPSKRFPAISITGDKCTLHCEHCNEKYLKGMKPVLNNRDLENFLLDHANKGGVGTLISGGCELNGSVPLKNFLKTIEKIKSQTNLIFNVHTGLLDEETAQKLAESKVDIISFDINMDDEIIRNIYHLDKRSSDYRKAINLLKEYGLNVVPHICIGLYYGEIHKELESIKFILDSKLNPSLIVLIALIPPKNRKTKFKTPNPLDIAKIITIIRILFPYTEISLGCMRPRGLIKVDIEKCAIKSGINRIEIPSSKTLKWLKRKNPNINFKFYSACCALPQKYEIFARSKDSEIRRYLNI
jgi:uncharacterized radical SAM superfamily protein